MAIEIAQAGLQAMGFGFEDNKMMLLPSGDGVGKSKLEGHVETGNPEGA